MALGTLGQLSSLSYVDGPRETRLVPPRPKVTREVTALKPVTVTEMSLAGLGGTVEETAAKWPQKRSRGEGSS